MRWLAVLNVKARLLIVRRKICGVQRAILKEILSAAQEDDAVLLFIHGNLIRYIIAHFLQISKVNLWEGLEIHDASISLVEITNNRPQVRLINSIEHLSKKEVDKFYNGYTKIEYRS